MERRNFLKAAAVGAVAAPLATPALAAGHKTMTIVSTWPRDFPGLGISAQRLAARITELSDGDPTLSTLQLASALAHLTALTKSHQATHKRTSRRTTTGWVSTLASRTSHLCHLA